MSPDAPDPEAPRPGSPRADDDTPRPPRVLVSVGDLEDPTEWDVILVENQDVDDDMARRIAAERAGRPLRPMRRLGPPAPAPTVSLPSLDERDVIEAFETDRDAEDAAEVDESAFAPPDDGTPLRPRLAPIELLHDEATFAGMPEPGLEDPEDEAEPEAEADPDPDVEELEPAFGTPVIPPPSWEPDALVLPWQPAVRDLSGPKVLDDPDDDFYAIGADDDVEIEIEPEEVTATEGGDEVAEASDLAAGAGDDSMDTDEAAETETAADEVTAIEADGEDADAEGGDADTDDAAADAEGGDDAPEIEAAEADEPNEWDPEAGSLDERELLDDPEDLFYAVGRARIAAFKPSEPPGGISLPAPTAPLTSALWGTDITAPLEQDDEVFEEELEIDSSFPLGPDDLVTDREVEPVQLDELDYANVFGPVAGGTRRVKDLAAHDPRRKPSPSYDSALYVFDEDDAHRPVPVPRGGGRRRELLALGLAAGVIVALGVGSQVFASDDDPQDATPVTTTSTTIPRSRSSDVTIVPDLTLPTAPSETTVVPDEGDDGTTETTRRRTTTTTAPRNNNTTTTAPPQTTTTAAPTTTTEAPAPTTTEAPPPTIPGDDPSV